MKIREAVESDLPAIIDIYNRSVEEGVASTNTRPTTVTRSKGWFRQHKASGKSILVAEDNGKIIGWLSVRPFFRRPAYDSTAKVLVYIAPGDRKKGVGGELLANALAQSPSIGINAARGVFVIAKYRRT